MQLGVTTLDKVFYKRISEAKPWTEVELVKISFMLVDAMRIARQYGVHHRDLSLNNVVLSTDLT